MAKFLAYITVIGLILICVAFPTRKHNQVHKSSVEVVVNQMPDGYSGLWLPGEFSGSGFPVETGNQPDLPSDAVLVAVLDTGVALNDSQIASAIWINKDEVAENKTDDDKNSYIDDHYGYNPVKLYSPPQDDNGHGTHIAGCILGLCKYCTKDPALSNIRLVIVKVLDSDGEGYVNDLIYGIDYARWVQAKTKRRMVINASWRTIEGPKPLLEEAIKRAGQEGILFIAGAGNDKKPQPAYPAAYDDLPNVISVGASEGSLLAKFSNHNAEIAAPGVDIESLNYKGGTIKMSGTSMAAPFVTQTAALMLAKCPTCTPEEIKQSILDSADILPQLKEVKGQRELNAAKALSALRKKPKLP
jgi:subtilisin family serine protease